MTYRHLYHELEVIAGDELGDVLDAWNDWDAEQAERLARYLRSELQPYGMLSVEKAREAGHALGTERREARTLLRRLA